MTGGKGGTTETTSTTQSPPPQFLSAYTNLVNKAQRVTDQAPQAYTGPMVAGFTPQQKQAFKEIGQAQGIANPYINSASQMIGQANTPFYDTVQNYESPYTSAVTNSLQGLFNQQNAQQLQQVQGNATAAGAYGGDREAVAQALTAQQQNLSEAPTLANVLQGGYQTALGGAESQGWLGEQGAFGLGSLGQEAQNTALTGAQALYGAGSQQQQLAQERLNIPYEQFEAAQAAPYQNLNELASVVEGAGSLAGGTGSTTYPGPNMISQGIGLGTTGLGLAGLLGWTPFAKAGGRIGLQAGGASTPSTGPTFAGMSLPAIPQINLDYIAPPGPAVKGSGPPHPPPVPGQQQNPMQQGLGALTQLGQLERLGSNNANSAANNGFMIPGTSTTLTPDQMSANLEAADYLPSIEAGAPGTLAHGGHLQTGGLAASPGIAMGSQGPGPQSYMQQFLQMPMDQLQSYAARFPPGSALGQIVQMAINTKRMNPTAGGAQVSSAGGVPVGTGMGLASAATQQPQQTAGPGMAVGGIVGLQEGGNSPANYESWQRNQNMIATNPREGDMAAWEQAYSRLGPQGMADRNFKLRQDLLQISPNFRTGGMVHGGAMPQIADQPDMDPQPVVDHSGDTVVIHYPSEGKHLDLGIPSAPRQKRAAGGTVQGAPPGSTEASHFNFLPTAEGINIPQLRPNLDAPTAANPSGGMGKWFNPLPQYHPPGEHEGPGGSLVFPSKPLYSKGEVALNPGVYGLGGGGGGGGGGQNSDAGGLSQADRNAAMLAAQNNFAPDTGSGKKGGRVGLQGGGDADVESPPFGGVYEADPFGGEQPATRGEGLGAVTTMPPAHTAPGLPSAGAPEANPEDQAFRTLMQVRGTPVGEPPAPHAQITPDRAPPPVVTAPPPDRSELPAPKTSAATPPTSASTAPLPQVPNETVEGPGPAATVARPTLKPIETTGQPQGTSPAATPPPENIPGGKAAGNTEAPDWLYGRITQAENSPNGSVSSKGALGLNQIMPDTARQYGFNDMKRLQNDEGYNTQAQHTIVNDLWRRYGGDPQAVMVAYNAGPTVADRWIAGGKDAALLPAETQHYIGVHGAPGAGQPDGGDEVLPADTPLPQQGPSTQDQLTTLATHILQQTPPEHRSGMANWMNSPWFPVFMAGAGMLASRSPFPGVALGEGLEQAARGMETVAGQQTRQQELANEAANRQAALGVDVLKMQQEGRYQSGELAQRQQQYLQTMKTENDRFQYEMAREKDAQKREAIAEQHYENMDRINADFKAYQMAKPIAGYDEQGRPGSWQFDPQAGGYKFNPGATIGRPLTAQYKQQAWLAAHPGDTEGSLAYMNGQKAMNPQEMSIAAQKLAEQDLTADPSTAGMSQGQRQSRLQQLTQAHLTMMGASATAAPTTGGQRPTASAMPPWAVRGGTAADGTRVFADQQGNVFTADHQPYQPQQAQP